jgi:hypothetical protein
MSCIRISNRMDFMFMKSMTVNQVKELHGDSRNISNHARWRMTQVKESSKTTNHTRLFALRTLIGIEGLLFFLNLFHEYFARQICWPKLSDNFVRQFSRQNLSTYLVD